MLGEGPCIFLLISSFQLVYLLNFYSNSVLHGLLVSGIHSFSTRSLVLFLKLAILYLGSAIKLRASHFSSGGLLQCTYTYACMWIYHMHTYKYVCTIKFLYATHTRMCVYACMPKCIHVYARVITQVYVCVHVYNV